MRNEIIKNSVASDGWLRSFVRRWTKNDQDAEDIIQESYYQLIKAIDLADNPIENISAWLYRSMKNLLINHGKKRKEKLPGEALESLPGTNTDEKDRPEIMMLREMIWDELGRALDELPTDQRDAFILTELDGLSVKSAATKQGVPINTLLSRKHYAVIHLRKRMSQLYKDITEF